jgi:hypothetical protein
MQSARLSLQSSQLATPPPRPQASVGPPPLVPGGGDTLACWRLRAGAGADSDERDRRSGTLGYNKIPLRLGEQTT